ncbi:hypothetical protein [Actinomadura sp. 6N118]|uniref:hypothetical protein n=1 Tax=Actinomadura sp. 6N118 TaxID=3375151 RepID=UPI0037C1152A
MHHGRLVHLAVYEGPDLRVDDATSPSRRARSPKTRSFAAVVQMTATARMTATAHVASGAAFRGKRPGLR